MDLDGLNQLVADVFGPNTPTKVINGWLSMRCPLAPWTHESRKDSRPSAGISIQPNDVSVFNCMTCHTKVPLHALIETYASYTGENLDALVEELEDEAYLGPRGLPEWGAHRSQPLSGQQTPLDKAVYLDLYDSAAGHPYLRKRGISDDTAEFLQLKLDPCAPGDKEERILFPIFGVDQELYGFSGRATRKIPPSDKTTLKVRDYAGFRKALNILGSHLILPENAEYLLLTEGLFDYANGWQQGFPTVATMHSTFTEQQAEILREIGKPVYLFQDDDTAGRHGAKMAAEMLRNDVPVMGVTWPRIWIDNPNEDDGGHWVKDLGELLHEDINEMIENATLL